LASCFICRVPIKKKICGLVTESSLSIAERVQNGQLPVQNFVDPQKQSVEEPRDHMDGRNFLKVDTSCSVSGASQHNSESHNVPCATDEGLVENGQTVAVCVSLIVNGDTCASSSSALNSWEASSDHATIIKVDADGELLCDKEAANVYESEVPHGCITGPQDWYEDESILDSEQLVRVFRKTDVVKKVVVDELVSEVVDGEDGSFADCNVCDGHQETLAAEEHQNVLDSGKMVPANADSGLLKTGHDQICWQNLDARAHDIIGESTDLDEVGDVLSDHGVNSADVPATRAEDTDCHSRMDSVLPVNVRGVVPAGRSVKSQLSDIATDIENLESWIHNAIVDVQLNAVGTGALGVVEQYASELQKKKVELDRLHAQVKQLDKLDKNVSCKEWNRLVSVHAQLHSLSASLNTIASQAVCYLTDVLQFFYVTFSVP